MHAADHKFSFRENLQSNPGEEIVYRLKVIFKPAWRDSARSRSLLHSMAEESAQTAAVDSVPLFVILKQRCLFASLEPFTT